MMGEVHAYVHVQARSLSRFEQEHLFGGSSGESEGAPGGTARYRRVDCCVPAVCTNPGKSGAFGVRFINRPDRHLLTRYTSTRFNPCPTEHPSSNQILRCKRGKRLHDMRKTQERLLLSSRCLCPRHLAGSAGGTQHIISHSYCLHIAHHSALSHAIRLSTQSRQSAVIALSSLTRSSLDELLVRLRLCHDDGYLRIGRSSAAGIKDGGLGIGHGVSFEHRLKAHKAPDHELARDGKEGLLECARHSLERRHLHDVRQAGRRARAARRHWKVCDGVDCLEKEARWEDRAAPQSGRGRQLIGDH